MRKISKQGAAVDAIVPYSLAAAEHGDGWQLINKDGQEEAGRQSLLAALTLPVPRWRPASEQVKK